MERADRKVWDEWIAFDVVPPVEDEITGILDGLTGIEAGCEMHYASGRLLTVRRLMKLWPYSEYQQEGAEGIKLLHTQLREKICFAIEIEAATKILQRSVRIGKRRRNWNWMRGLWGSCGALYVPKSGYHLVVRPPEGTAAERVQTILRSAGFAVGVRKKNSIRELMLRDQQQIVTFLSRIGFVQSALALEETAMFRLMRSHANKLVNCDAANISKSVSAAKDQLRLIAELERSGLIKELPDSLSELVFARKKNPSISLKELGQSLPRPISKSTVEYRWKKLENIINEISKGDGPHVLGKGRRQHLR